MSEETETTDEAGHDSKGDQGPLEPKVPLVFVIIAVVTVILSAFVVVRFLADLCANGRC